MKVSEIPARRLRNLRLTGPSFTSPVDAIRWHGAMQAQDYGPAKWSVGQRSTGVGDKDLDRALAEGSIVRTHVLRPTWHFVARDDLRWLLALSGPRVHQHMRARLRQLGLDDQVLVRCRAIIVSALKGGMTLTRNEIGSILEHAGIDRSGQRLAHILGHCELEVLICSGGLKGKHHSYALADERVPNEDRFDRDEALVELTRRYLRSHGPAAVEDFRWWASLTVADIRKALDMLGAQVQSEIIDDVVLWSMASDSEPPPRAHGVHLLQAYDELVVGYTRSRFLGDPQARRAQTAWRDRTLPNGFVLWDGRLAGHWRRTNHKDSTRLEVFTYEQPKAIVPALQAAGDNFGAFTGREVTLTVRGID